MPNLFTLLIIAAILRVVAYLLAEVAGQRGHLLVREARQRRVAGVKVYEASSLGRRIPSPPPRGSSP
jgi:hypothetical protein